MVYDPSSANPTTVITFHPIYCDLRAALTRNLKHILFKDWAKRPSRGAIPASFPNTTRSFIDQMWKSPTSENMRFTLTALTNYAPKETKIDPLPYQHESTLPSSTFTYPLCTLCPLSLPATAIHTYLSCPANADIHNNMDISIGQELDQHTRTSTRNPIHKLTDKILDTFQPGPESYIVPLTDMNHHSLPPAMRSRPHFLPTHILRHLIYDILMTHPRLLQGELYAINYPTTVPTNSTVPISSCSPNNTLTSHASHPSRDPPLSATEYTTTNSLSSRATSPSIYHMPLVSLENIPRPVSQEKPPRLTQTPLTFSPSKKRKRPFNPNTSTTDRPASQIASLLKTVYSVDNNHLSPSEEWTTCNPLFTICFQHLHTTHCPNTDYINSPAFIRNILMENYHDTLENTPDILMLSPLRWGTHTWINPTHTVSLLLILSQLSSCPPPRIKRLVILSTTSLQIIKDHIHSLHDIFPSFTYTTSFQPDS